MAVTQMEWVGPQSDVLDRTVTAPQRAHARADAPVERCVGDLPWAAMILLGAAMAIPFGLVGWRDTHRAMMLVSPHIFIEPGRPVRLYCAAREPNAGEEAGLSADVILWPDGIRLNAGVGIDAGANPVQGVDLEEQLQSIFRPALSDVRAACARRSLQRWMVTAVSALSGLLLGGTSAGLLGAAAAARAHGRNFPDPARPEKGPSPTR